MTKNRKFEMAAAATLILKKYNLGT